MRSDIVHQERRQGQIGRWPHRLYSPASPGARRLKNISLKRYKAVLSTRHIPIKSIGDAGSRNRRTRVAPLSTLAPDSGDEKANSFETR